MTLKTIKSRVIFSVLALLLSISAFAQNLTVTGTVTDSATGQPVPFAAIQLKGTMTGGMTDADGNYAINAPANGNRWQSHHKRNNASGQ